jgi:hypothetical protein
VNSGPNVFGLRISLLDHRPEIWRRVLVHGSLRLDQLHLVFQEVMGWTNSHLHQFRIGDALYGMHFEDWPEEELHETEFNLADVAHAGERFRYDYDFSDSWEHEVVVERTDTIRPVGGRRLQPRGLRSRRHERRAPAPPLINSPTDPAEGP